MNEKELNDKIESLTLINKMLKNDNKKLREKLTEFEKKIKIYDEFLNGGNNGKSF